MRYLTPVSHFIHNRIFKDTSESLVLSRVAPATPQSFLESVDLCVWEAALRRLL
jgi:hypothetical protein